MIGIIGAVDSVELVRRAAAELALGHAVLSRSYEQPAQALELAEELEVACSRLLFTGRLPYTAVRAARPEWHPRLSFIPHSGVDLYRALCVLLLSRGGGGLPGLTIDVIEEQVVAESLEDLWPSTRYQVLPLEAEPDRLGRVIDDLAAQHEAAWRAGEAEVALTCLRAVDERLRETGVPCLRITHTKTTVREALTTAWLRQRVERAEASQPAVGLVAARDGSAPSPEVRAHAEALAARLGGTVLERGEHFILHATRESVEQELLARSAPEGEDAGGPGAGVVGIGLGETTSQAEIDARQALSMARRQQASLLVFANGALVEAPAPAEADLPDAGWPARRGAELGVAPYTLHRIVQASRRQGSDLFTAPELADLYGTTVRSARRVIGRLSRAGVLVRAGVRRNAGAGRPTTVYRLDLERLLRGDPQD